MAPGPRFAMFSVLGLFLLASCQSISEFVCNTNSSIANQLRWLAMQLRQTLRCRRAVAKSRKRHRLRIAVGSQQAQCLCQRKAPVRQELARKNIHDAGATGSRRSEHGSSATDTAPTDGADQGSKYRWIVVGNLLFGVVLLAVAHTYMTNLRTTGQSPNAHIIAACNFAQLLAILDPRLGYSKTCAPSDGQPGTGNQPPSPASKRKWAEKCQATTNQRQSRKSKKQKNSRPAIGQSSSDGEGGNGKLLACPFLKFDIDTYRPCGGLTLRGWPQMLQHIKRSHLLGDFYCPKCWTTFGSQEQSDDHIRDVACQTRLQPDEFDANDIKKLEQETKKMRGGRDEDKWFWLWAEFFKDHTKPNSPYILSHAQDLADLLRRRPETLNNALHDARLADQGVTGQSFLDVLLAADPSLSSRPLRRHAGARPDMTTAAPAASPSPYHLVAGAQQEQYEAETLHPNTMNAMQGIEPISTSYTDLTNLDTNLLSTEQDPMGNLFLSDPTDYVEDQDLELEDIEQLLDDLRQPSGS